MALLNLYLPRYNLTNSTRQTLYAFTTQFFILGYTCTHESLGGCTTTRQSFSYFTNITYWGIVFYLLVSSIHTFTYALHGRPLLSAFPRPLQALHSLFYTTIVTLPILVTIVFWSVLYGGTEFKIQFHLWQNISIHGLNSLFALVEILLPRTDPFPWIHLPFLILILLGYLAVAYITVADQGFYTYNFLDHDKIGGRGYVAAYVIGIAVGIVVIFVVVKGLIWLRRWVTETKLGMTGKVAAARPARECDEEMAAIAK